MIKKQESFTASTAFFSSGSLSVRPCGYPSPVRLSLRASSWARGLGIFFFFLGGGKGGGGEGVGGEERKRNSSPRPLSPKKPKSRAQELARRLCKAVVVEILD